MCFSLLRLEHCYIKKQKQQTDSKLGKEYVEAVYCHPAYLTYMQSIMQNAKLDESQAGIKITGRNINNLRYAYDSTLMAEIEEELKSLLMKVKEKTEKAGLKLNTQNTKIMASGPITSCRWGKSGSRDRFIFLGSRITVDSDYSHKRCLFLGRKAMANLDSILISKDIALTTKIHSAKAMVFAVVMCKCGSLTIKKAECQRTDASQLWY